MHNKSSNSAMLSTKHLVRPEYDLLSPRSPGKTKTLRQILADMTTTTTVDFNRDDIVRLRTNPSYVIKSTPMRRGDAKEDYAFSPFFGTSITRHSQRTPLWEAMFGQPKSTTWNRFVTPFLHDIEPALVKLGRGLNSIKSYMVLDWLTNLLVPRDNQYDPVDYFHYCEEHLQYSPAPVIVRRDDFDSLRMHPLWLDTAPLTPFKHNLYPIDDNCKAMLEAMFVVKPVVKKRII